MSLHLLHPALSSGDIPRCPCHSPSPMTPRESGWQNRSEWPWKLFCGHHRVGIQAECCFQSRCHEAEELFSAIARFEELSLPETGAQVNNSYLAPVPCPPRRGTCGSSYAPCLFLPLLLICLISSSLRSSTEDAQKGLNPIFIYTSPLQAAKKKALSNKETVRFFFRNTNK